MFCWVWVNFLHRSSCGLDLQLKQCCWQPRVLAVTKQYLHGVKAFSFSLSAPIVIKLWQRQGAGRGENLKWEPKLITRLFHMYNTVVINKNWALDAGWCCLCNVVSDLYDLIPPLSPTPLTIHTELHQNFIKIYWSSARITFYLFITLFVYFNSGSLEWIYLLLLSATKIGLDYVL